MPAKLVQRNSQPYKKLDVDTVTIDIIESALRNARFEMDTVLFRTAMSPGIREQHDEFPMIANVEGKMVVGQFGSFIYGFLQGYDGTIEDGDIFFTSDPYSVNGAISHANDWLMLMPIFREGRLLACAGSGQHSDAGGDRRHCPATIGEDPGRARDDPGVYGTGDRNRRHRAADGFHRADAWTVASADGRGRRLAAQHSRTEHRTRC